MIKQSSKKRISFYTFGCRLNQAETAVIKNSFQAGNYQVVDFAEPADVVVVNTCTVTENGDADTRKLVSKINRLNPRARIALIGCQAQIQKEKLAKLANVYWIVGNAKKFDLAEILQELDSVSTPQVIAPAIPREAFTIPVAGIDTDHTRANIKIQDGCDFFCSFCEIPYARGRARSREFQNILESSDTIFVCQKSRSTKALKLIEWDEKVVRRSGRSCCIICQKVPDVATTRESAGTSQILLL